MGDNNLFPDIGPTQAFRQEFHGGIMPPVRMNGFELFERLFGQINALVVVHALFGPPHGHFGSVIK